MVVYIILKKTGISKDLYFLSKMNNELKSDTLYVEIIFQLLRVCLTNTSIILTT